MALSTGRARSSVQRGRKKLLTSKPAPCQIPLSGGIFSTFGVSGECAEQDPVRVRIPSRPAGGGRFTHLAVRRARTGRSRQLRLRVHRPRRFRVGGGEDGGRALPALADASTTSAASHTSAETDTNAHPYPYADTHAHAYAHTDSDTHADSDSNADSPTDTDADQGRAEADTPARTTGPAARTRARAPAATAPGPAPPVAHPVPEPLTHPVGPSDTVPHRPAHLPQDSAQAAARRSLPRHPDAADHGPRRTRRGRTAPPFFPLIR